mmetsp:Transcript_11631/g.40139  ORF Transcript_11631/g.40139 Transcript_11631/m.40139 type:complete len:158 (+) Transcript_11631:858-1331(+)
MASSDSLSSSTALCSSRRGQEGEVSQPPCHDCSSSESGKCIKRKPKDVRSCGTRVNNVLETLEAADAEGVKDRLLSHLHRRMCALGATSQEEAKAYLSLANNDVEVAVKMYQEDLAWEKQGGSATKFPGTPSCIQDMTTRKSFFNKLSSKLRSKQIY